MLISFKVGHRKKGVVSYPGQGKNAASSFLFFFFQKKESTARELVVSFTV